MRVEELTLPKLLRTDPGGGVVRFAGQRALIFDAASQGLLRKELIETFSEKTARGILSHYGYIHGRRLAESLRKKFKWDSDEEWQKAGFRILALQGLFQLDPKSPDAFGPAGGSWSVSYEAEQHLLLKGRSENPVCWNLCGLISGYMSFVKGREMFALEDKCMGKGDAACHVTVKAETEWDEEQRRELWVFKRVVIEDTLREVTTTLQRTENALREKTRRLEKMAEIEEDPSELMVRSPEMRNLVDLARTIATVDSTVLITGESGCGKERVARYVHDHSARANGPFIAVNCGAITDTLLESELFGHARGSFTGATSDRPGLFEAANGGTLLLDEVGEISLPMQVKLLRAIEEKEVRRVGENKSRPLNVRLLSATNKDLKAEVAKKNFREDLYYRLNVVELPVPSLRTRREDILPLARLLLAGAALQMKRPVDGLTVQAADRLLEYSWPGNVRELGNAMERAVAVAKTNRVDVTDLPHEIQMDAPHHPDPQSGEPHSLNEVEKECILTVLKKTGGNRRKAADILKVGVATLYRKLKAYRLDRDDPEDGSGPA